MQVKVKKLLLVSLLIAVNAVYGKKLDRDQLSKEVTDSFIKYLDDRVSEDIIRFEHLERMEKEGVLNPLTQEDADSDDNAFIHHKQLRMIIERVETILDKKRIKEWVSSAIDHLKEHQFISNQVSLDTKDILRPLHFVAIPQGSYTNLTTSKPFVIGAGIYMQDTPVTQYQWASVMGDDPVKERGKDVQEMIIEGKRILMVPNNFVHSVSYGQIQEFIRRHTMAGKIIPGSAGITPSWACKKV
jgi:hypothetical protein